MSTMRTVCSYLLCLALACDRPDPRAWLDSTATSSLTDADRELLAAASRGDAAAVEAAMARGARPDAVSDTVVEGISFAAPAIVLAARDGHVEVVRALLRAGAKVDARTGLGGETALVSAAIDGHADVVDALLVAGASVDLPNAWGKTALMWASDNGHDAAVRRLLAGGADVTRRCDEGRTAADYADDPAVLALLRGAEPSR
ncbi:MAG: ankyrin repeat domain-containing protein [Deltaproteobacteria bacterium]|nr:ankyrin repeat domain-containing protein [Deltaproteobacteria bacterium]